MHFINISLDLQEFLLIVSSATWTFVFVAWNGISFEPFNTVHMEHVRTGKKVYLFCP